MAAAGYHGLACRAPEFLQAYASAMALLLASRVTLWFVLLASTQAVRERPAAAVAALAASAAVEAVAVASFAWHSTLLRARARRRGAEARERGGQGEAAASGSARGVRGYGTLR